jgi:hypothetical protein
MARRSPKKGTNKNSEELEGYLTNKLNLDIYTDLTEGDWANVFEPLEFFHLLYTQFEFVKNNKSKPLSVVKSINELSLNDTQKNALLYYLEDVIGNENGRADKGKDTQLEICRTFISKECNRIAEQLGDESDERVREDISPTDAKKFDFGEVKKHLETLPDTKEKIKFLLEIKTENQQMVQFDFNIPSFAEKCELEIQKLKQQMALEKANRSPAESHSESIKRNPEFTTARQVLAVHYLLRHAKAPNVNKTEIARFIEFLTGKNYDSIYKKVREPLKLKDNEAKKDLEFVKGYFLKLELPEVVRMIDNEIAQGF